MQCEITDILLNPNNRKEYIKGLLEIDGLENIEEVVDACYCAVPLTGVPKEKIEELEKDHDTIKSCIEKAGITIYDPKDAGYNPQVKIRDMPEKVYDADTMQVVTPRFFEFTNIAASTGSGIEQQKAIAYNRIAVVFAKDGIYTSRMSTGARRIILLEYHDLKKEANDITLIFTELKKFEPGIGICSKHGNALLGFRNGEVFCLKGLIEEMFPAFIYKFEKYRK